MRSDLFIAAAASALLSATSAGSVACGKTTSQELAYYVSCGDRNTISECFEEGFDLVDLANIKYCLTSGGCSNSDASEEAVWIASACGSASGWADEDAGELRKRASTTAASDTASTTATSDTSASTDATTTNEKRSTTATSDATTTDATTTSDTSTTASSTTSSTTSSTSTGTSSMTTSTITSSSSSSSSSSNTCLSTKTKTTSACSTVTGVTSCTQTTALSSACAPGKLCSTDSSGSDVCMTAENDLTTSGLIVTICFCAFIGTFIISLTTMACRNNRKEAAKKAASEALSGDDMKVSSTSSATYMAINNDNPSMATKASPLKPFRLSRERTNSFEYSSSPGLPIASVGRPPSSESLNIATASAARSGGYSGVTTYSDGGSPTASEHGSFKGRQMV